MGMSGNPSAKKPGGPSGGNRAGAGRVEKACPLQPTTHLPFLLLTASQGLPRQLVHMLLGSLEDGSLLTRKKMVMLD